MADWGLQLTPAAQHHESVSYHIPLAQERSLRITFAPLTKNGKSNHCKLGTVSTNVFFFFLHNLSTRNPTWVMSEGEAVFLRLGHHPLFLKMEMRQPAKTGTGRARITNPNRLAKGHFEGTFCQSALPCPLLL